MSLAVAVAVVAVVAARSGHHSILISMAKSCRSKQTAPESPTLTLPHPSNPPCPSNCASNLANKTRRKGEGEKVIANNVNVCFVAIDVDDEQVEAKEAEEQEEEETATTTTTSLSAVLCCCSAFCN